jgi:hypothetical protein
MEEGVWRHSSLKRPTGLFFSELDVCTSRNLVIPHSMKENNERRGRKVIKNLLSWFLQQYMGPQGQTSSFHGLFGQQNRFPFEIPGMLPFPSQNAPGSNQQPSSSAFPPWMWNVARQMFSNGNLNFFSEKEMSSPMWPFGEGSPFWMMPGNQQQPFDRFPFMPISERKPTPRRQPSPHKKKSYGKRKTKLL